MKKMMIILMVLWFSFPFSVYAQLFGGSAAGAIANRHCSSIGLGCGGGIKSQQQEGLTAFMLFYSVETEALLIEIKTTEVAKTNPEAWAYLKSNTTLTTDANTAIEASVLRKLNLPESTVIPPGTYQITRKSDGFEIAIPLKSRK